MCKRTPPHTPSLLAHRAALPTARPSRGIWKRGRWQTPGWALACRTDPAGASARSSSSFYIGRSFLPLASTRQEQTRVVTAGLRRCMHPTRRAPRSPHHRGQQRGRVPAGSWLCPELALPSSSPCHSPRGKVRVWVPRTWGDPQAQPGHPLAGRVKTGDPPTWTAKHFGAPGPRCPLFLLRAQPLEVGLLANSSLLPALAPASCAGQSHPSVTDRAGSSSACQEVAKGWGFSPAGSAVPGPSAGSTGQIRCPEHRPGAEHSGPAWAAALPLPPAWTLLPIHCTTPREILLKLSFFVW